MKLEIDMLRVLYLVNIYQPVPWEELVRAFVKGERSERVLVLAVKRLQSDGYLNGKEPFSCRPKALAALQSVKLYKSRDAGRLFHLKALAKSGKVDQTSG